MYSINDEAERKRRKDNFFFYHWIEKEEEEVNVYDVYLLKERERERVDKKMLRVNE